MERFSRALHDLELSLADYDLHPRNYKLVMDYLKASHQDVHDKALALIEHLAGEQQDEETIDVSFNLPGLGNKINQLRRAIGEDAK